MTTKKKAAKKAVQTFWAVANKPDFIEPCLFWTRIDARRYRSDKTNPDWFRVFRVEVREL